MYGSRLEVKRFEDRIVKHEAYPVEEGMILFYGHSLFTRCSNITNFKENPMIEECVRMKDGSKAIINHAFGTSSADDLLYYYHRMVKPYKPRALVLATMDNDVGFSYSARDVMAAHVAASVVVTRPTMPVVRDPSQINIPVTAVQSMATKETARAHMTPMQSTAARSVRHSAMLRLTPMLLYV